MKALREIGWRKALRFGGGIVLQLLLHGALLPPLRALWLRLGGARLGGDCVIHDLRLQNLYRTGLRGLRLGPRCFIGEEVMLDLADEIELGAEVTLASRVMILTHLNVGFRDHPLQAAFPAQQAPVRLGAGCFVGAGAIILAGVELGPRCFVAAGAVVTQSFPEGSVIAGVPGRRLGGVDEAPVSSE